MLKLHYMNLDFILDLFQIIIAILLIIVVLLQNQGAGAGATFGGSGGVIKTTRRGPEKFLFVATITLAVIFLVVSLVNSIL